MNKDTMEAFPSLDRIAKDSGCSKPTIMKIIKQIEQKGYITISHVGKLNSNVYKFNNEKSFEPFSYEFLDNKNLTKSEKLQILCTQQYMYKTEGLGKISYSDSELCELTGLNWRTLNKNNSTLMNKGYMSQIYLSKRNKLTGELQKETIYHLNDLGQAIVFALKNHEERISKNTEDVQGLKTQMDQLQKTVEQLTRDRDIALNEVKRLNQMLTTPINKSYQM